MCSEEREEGGGGSTANARLYMLQTERARRVLEKFLIKKKRGGLRERECFSVSLSHCLISVWCLSAAAMVPGPTAPPVDPPLDTPPTSSPHVCPCI